MEISAALWAVRLRKDFTFFYVLISGYHRLGYSIFTDPNEKFINVDVRAFVKSHAKEPHFGKSSYRLKVSCNNQPDSNADCVIAPNRFSLMLCDVINYNDDTSTICSHEYAIFY